MAKSWVIRVDRRGNDHWYVTGVEGDGDFTYSNQPEQAVHFARKQDAQTELDYPRRHSGYHRSYLQIVPSEVKIPESVFKAVYSGPPDKKLRWVKDIAKWVADLFK